MRILALDTSTEYLSLALLLDDRPYTRDIHAGQSHSQQILPVLQTLLAEASVALTDLDGIAYGAGPGSFTGLRIGCGVAQGLAFGANLPVVGVSTLMALAQAAWLQTGAEKIIACLDARMGEIYHAIYIRQEETWQEVSAPGLYKPEAAPVLMEQGFVGAGSGWDVYADALNAQYAHQINQTLPEISPRALMMAQLALPLFASGQGKPAHEAAPVYIRNKVALKMSER